MWDWLSGLGKSIGGAGKTVGAGIKKPFDMLAGHGGNPAMGDGGGAMAAMGGFKPPITTPGFNPSASMPELSGMSPTFKSPVNIPMTASAGPDIRERLAPMDLPVQPNLRLPNTEGIAMDRQAPRFQMPLGQPMGGTATAAPSGYVDPIEAKRAAYVEKDMQIPRWKRVLRDTVLGGAQGVAHRRPGDDVLGSLLGGMAAGGVAQGVAPKMIAEGRYEGLQQPRDEASMERESAAEKQRLAMENLRRQQDLTGSQIKENEAQAAYNNARIAIEEEKAKKAPPRRVGASGWGTYDMETGNPIWVKPQEAKALKAEKPIGWADAEAERSAMEGTAEEIAQSSLEGRKDALWGQLSPTEQAAFQNPSNDPDGYAKAQARWQKIQDDEYRRILADTKARARQKAGEIRLGGSKKPFTPSFTNANNAPNLF